MAQQKTVTPIPGSGPESGAETELNSERKTEPKPEPIVHINEDLDNAVNCRYVTVNPVEDDSEGIDQRLETFDKCKLLNRKQASQMAEAGLAYTGIGDRVECKSCGIQLYNWKEDSNPIQNHKNYSPDCEFMNKTFPDVKAPPKSNTPLKVKYPNYSNYLSRLDSFNDLSFESVAQKPEMLAKSGFFYLGQADRTRCFHCGVTLRDWETDDYPPCAHKQWSRYCPFVQQLDFDDLRKEIEN